MLDWFQTEMTVSSQSSPDLSEPCRLYIGGSLSKGAPVFSHEGRAYSLRRALYHRSLNLPYDHIHYLPDGSRAVLRRHCSDRRCVEPSHQYYAPRPHNAKKS